MIDKIGIEAEIGTLASNSKIKKEIPHIDIISDASIIIEDVNYASEIQFKPYKLEDLNLLKERLKKMGKFLNEINNSMGFHIHLSFKDYSDYLKLLSYKFFKSFIEQYKFKFQKDIEKARLENHYCQSYKLKNFITNTSSQLSSKSKNCSRYFAVNYNAYNLYNTIEFRIFPMVEDVSRLIEYLDFTINFVSKWLKKAKVNKNLTINTILKIKDKKIENKKVEFIKQNV